jgi:hypothetical protein
MSAQITPFIGASIIVTSITLFSKEGFGSYGDLAVQLVLLPLLTYLGHKFQDCIGIGGEHQEEKKNEGNYEKQVDSHDRL